MEINLDEIEFTVEKRQPKFGSPEARVFFGNVCVGEAYYSFANSKGDSKPWSASMKLPGFKHQTVKCRSMEDAIERIKKRTGIWFGWIAEKKTLQK